MPKYQPPKRPEALPESVNSRVDRLLRLVPLSSLDARERDHHRIRVMQVGARCEVLTELSDWARSSPDEYKRILNGLRRIAENEELPPLATIKRVGDSRQIIEVVGNSSRLFCFEDDDGNTVICAGAFRIGGGDKTAAQNQAIRGAEALLHRWKSATPVEIKGFDDVRVEPIRK